MPAGSYVGTTPEISYSWGREDHRRAHRGEPPLHNRDSDPFWYSLGLNMQAQGDPELPWPRITEIAYTQAQRDRYMQGWERGIAITEGKPPPYVVAPTDQPSYGTWLNAGLNDARSGLYKWPRYVLTDLPPPPSRPPGPGADVVVAPPVPLPAPPLYVGPPIFEVLATILGKRIPLDRLLTATRYVDAVLTNPLGRALWSASFDMTVLGDAPGEERRGYRLSGPTGAAAKWLAFEAARGRVLRPEQYGLKAWFVTRTQDGGPRGGVRFLSRQELVNLGIDPEL